MHGFFGLFDGYNTSYGTHEQFGPDHEAKALRNYFLMMYLSTLYLKRRSHLDEQNVLLRSFGWFTRLVIPYMVVQDQWKCSPPTLKFNFRDPVPGDLEHHLEAIWETGTHKKPGTHTIPILLIGIPVWEWDLGVWPVSGFLPTRIGLTCFIDIALSILFVFFRAFQILSLQLFALELQLPKIC